MGPVVFGHFGPARHGVRRFGHALAQAVGRVVPVVEVGADDDRELLTSLVTSAQVERASAIHVQYSDYLQPGSPFGGPWFAELRERVAPATTVVVTMHDLPYVGHDDAVTDGRRSARYRAVADRADLVIVASSHEQQGLARTGHGPAAVVIPHLVESRPVTGPQLAVADRPTIGILGFVYPGKGHADVIDACGALGSAVRVEVLGRASVGHEALVDELCRQADDRQVEISVAGWIADDDLGDRLARVTVPVAPHPAPSASASVGTWWSARRRPIVPDSPHARHLVNLHPGGVALIAARSIGALTDAIAHAIADPTSTTLANVPRALSPLVIGRRHVAAYQECRT